MNQDSLLLDAAVLSTVQASVILGLKGRACLDKKRLRGQDPAYSVVGDSGPGRKPRVLYSLRNLINYGMRGENE